MREDGENGSTSRAGGCGYRSGGVLETEQDQQSSETALPSIRRVERKDHD